MNIRRQYLFLNIPGSCLTPYLFPLACNRLGRETRSRRRAHPVRIKHMGGHTKSGWVSQTTSVEEPVKYPSKPLSRQADSVGGRTGSLNIRQ